MQYGKDEQWALIRRVGDQIVSYCLKPQGPGRQIGTLMTLVGKWRQPTDGVQNFFADAPGGPGIILGDELPNICDVLCRFRVKAKALRGAHSDVRWLSSSSSR